MPRISLRVLGHRKNFAQIHLRRILEIVRDRDERDHRCGAVVGLLRIDEDGGRDEGDQCGNKRASHDEPPWELVGMPQGTDVGVDGGTTWSKYQTGRFCAKECFRSLLCS